MTNNLRRFGRVSTGRKLSDADLMVEAKAALGILDFELFRAAWRNWYGAEPDDRRLEPAFMSYLFTTRLPGYVRHFARQVLDAAVTGKLDPAAFGVERHVAQVAVTDLSDRFAATSMAWALVLTLVIVL
jgi:hypothetical protein